MVYIMGVNGKLMYTCVKKKDLLINRHGCHFHVKFTKVGERSEVRKLCIEYIFAIVSLRIHILTSVLQA